MMIGKVNDLILKLYEIIITIVPILQMGRLLLRDFPLNFQLDSGRASTTQLSDLLATSWNWCSRVGKKLASRSEDGFWRLSPVVTTGILCRVKHLKL